MERLADILIRHARKSAAGIVAITVAAGLFLALHGLRYDYSLENFFPSADPGIQEYRAFVEQYEPDDNVIVLGFEHPDLFSDAVLRDIDAISEAFLDIPDVIDVVSLTRFETIASTADGIEQRRIIPSIDPGAEAAARRRAVVLGDSLAVNLVVNPEGTATGLYVRLAREANNYHERARILRAIDDVLAPYQGRYEFRYSGIPFIRNAYVDALRVETVKFIFLSSLVIIAVLAWMFRTVRGVVMPLVVTYLGVIWTLAFMMVVGSAIDVLTSTVAAIILVVGVADSVHLLAKYYDGMASGLNKREAIREMIIRLGAATFLTSVTTAIGFGTLVSSNVVPMQRFGFFTAFGVVLTFAVSLVLLSSILLWTRPPKSAQVERLGRGRFTEALRGIDRFAFDRRYWTLGFTALLVLVALAGASRLEVNAFVNDDVGPNTRMYQDMVFFQENLASPISFELVLTAGEEDAFKDPASLERVDAVQRYLFEQPEIDRTVSIVDVMKRLNQAVHGDSAAYFQLPATRELAAQYLFLLELTDADILERFTTYDFSQVRISSTIDDIGSNAMHGFQARLDSALAAGIQPGWRTKQTGTVVLATNLNEYLTQSLLFSLGLAFLFISVIMGVLFRNAKMVLISLVPNVLPLLITAGVMGFAGIDIKPATAVIFSISFGIAVDDTIHYLARLRQESRMGHDLREAIRRTNLGTGKAIVFTSLILFGGFFVLLTSSFQSTTFLGILVSITIATAVFADLVLLPALLYLLKPELSTLSPHSGGRPPGLAIPAGVQNPVDAGTR